MRHLQAVPPDLPYFDRAHLGLVQMLRSMGARVHTGNAWIFSPHSWHICTCSEALGRSICEQTSF